MISQTARHGIPDETVETLRASLWKYSYKLPRGRSVEQRDLVQVGLLAALEAWGQVDESRGAVGGFLYRVATRAMQDFANENVSALRMYRSSAKSASAQHLLAKRVKFLQVGGLDAEGNPVDDSLPGLDVTEAAAQLRQLWARIDPTVLEYFIAEADGETSREIGAAAGCSHQTIRNRIKAAQERL